MEDYETAICRTHEDISTITGNAEKIGLTGGGIVFTHWLQLLCNLFNQEIIKTDIGVEGRGAAVFCAVALGDYVDVKEAAIAMQPAATVLHPVPLDADCARRLESFRNLSAQH